MAARGTRRNLAVSQHAAVQRLPLPPGLVTRPAEAPAAVNQEDVARRLRKRLNAVASIKQTPEYNDAYVYDGGSLPPTPDWTDLTISKRSWERSMQEWRWMLRRLSALH